MLARTFLAFVSCLITVGVAVGQTAPPPSPSISGSPPSSSISGANSSSSTGGATGGSGGAYQTADASFSGALTWSYPLQLPNGTHGVQPSLALSYFSQARNGMLGMGFQLTGLSVIERDASRGAVQFASTDTYVLDGQKLYWSSSDSQFHPERETYDRIQAFTVSGGTTPTANPNLYDSYWVVSKKDGTKLYYGQTVDSRIAALGKADAQAHPLARAWALNKVVDPLGNYYTVSYQSDSSTGAYYPATIAYTKNDSFPMTKWKEVRFVYGDRSDHAAVYSPTKVDLSKRLVSVDVYTEVNATERLWGRYQITYQYGVSLRSQILSIQKVGYNGETLPPTILTWARDNLAPSGNFSIVTPTGGAFQHNLAASFSSGNQGANIIPGDYNGDGRMDFIRQEKGSWADGSSQVFQVYLSTGNGAFSIQTPTGGAFQHNLAASFSSGNRGCNIIPGDYNGDGKMDFIRQERGSWADGSDQVFQVYFAQSNGTFAIRTPGDLTYQQRLAFSFGSGTQGANIIPGDYNGDGKMDFIRQEKGSWADDTNGTFQVYFSNGDGTFNIVTPVGAVYQSNLYASQSTGNKGVNIIPGDYNGDGKMDFLRQEKGSWADDYVSTFQVYLSLGDGTFNVITPSGDPYQHNLAYSFSSGNRGANIIPGDYNGDGKQDFIRQERGSWADGSSQVFQVYLSKGDGTFTIITPTGGSFQHNLAASFSSGNQGCNIIPGDYNGDGLMDFIRQERGSWADDSNEVFQVYVSKGDGTFVIVTPTGTAYQHNLAYSFADGNQGCYIIPGDYDGDGKMDFIRQEHGSWADGSSQVFQVYRATALTSSYSNGDLVTNIHLPTGGDIRADYAAAPQIPIVPGVSQPILPGATWPDVAFPSSRPLVTNIQFFDGLSTTMSTSYQYYNGLYLSGFSSDRADLGFEKVTKTDDNSGTRTVTTFSQDFPTQGLPTDVLVSGADGHKYRETITDYGSYQATPKVQFVSVKSVITRVYDGQDSTYVKLKKTFDSFDAQGNVTQATDWGPSNPDGTYSNANKVRQVSQFSWAPIGYLCRPIDVKNYSYDELGVEGVAKETKTYYDGSSILGSITAGLPTKVETVISNSPSVSAASIIGFDSWGNVVATTDASGVVTAQTNYDADYHSLPTSVTDAGGLTKTVSDWDATLQPKTVTDAQGNVARTIYDEFGRAVRTVSPLPRDSEVSPTTTNVFNDVVVISNGKISNPASTTSTQKTSGTTTLTAVNYVDGLGRGIQTKALAKAGGQWVTVDHYYDASGREYAVSNPYLTSSSAFSWSAANLASQTVTKSEFDALDRTTKTTLPDGNVRRVIYNQVLLTKIDELGHVTQIEDRGSMRYVRTYTGTYPNQALYTTTTMRAYRGKQTVENDKDNDISTPGNVTTTVLDLAGRKTQYIDPDMGTWTYQYNANGSLAQQTDAKGNVTAFDYDSAGRLVRKYHGATLDTTYSYGTTGYQRGLLETVSRATDVTAYTYDVLGRTTGVTKTIGAYGSRTVSLGYDTDGRLATRQISGSGETVSYGYSPEGDLYSLAGNGNYLSSVTLDGFGRISGLSYGNATTTSYTFDPVTLRMTGIVTPGVQDLQYSFDAAGNVSTKIDNLYTAASESYLYDELNRLTTAWGIYGNRTYLYDRLNNLLGMNGAAVNTYSGTDPHQLVADNNYTYGYDENGNMTSRKVAGVTDRSYVYDVENRLAAATVGGVETDYTYDDTRRRTTMTVGTKTTVFWFDDYEETYTAGVLSETVRSYSAGGKKIAQSSSVSGLVFVYSDSLGSTSKVKDASGTVSAKYYEPFGALAASDDGTVRQLFTGKEWDSSADLFYYDARYYSPSLGRFVQGDPSLVSLQYQSQLTLAERMNPYLYGLDNPVSFSDPTGLWTIGLGIVFGYNGGKFSIGVGAAFDLADNTKEKTQGFNFSTMVGGNGFQGTFSAGFTAGNGDYNGYYSNLTINGDGLVFEQSFDLWEIHESSFIYFTETERSFGFNSDIDGVSLIGFSAGWQADAGLFADAYVPGVGVYADTSGNVQADLLGLTYNAGKFGPESGFLMDYTYGHYAGAKRKHNGNPIDLVDQIAFDHDRAGMSWNSNARAAHRARNLLQYHNRELTPYQRVAARNLLLLGFLPIEIYAAYTDWDNHH